MPAVPSAVSSFSLVLLPYARSVMQIWRNTLITPSWPIGVAPLVFSYHKKRSSYANLVETILACDALYWLGHGREACPVRNLPSPSPNTFIKCPSSKPQQPGLAIILSLCAMQS